MQPNTGLYLEMKATFTEWGTTSQEAEKGCGNCYK